MAPMGNQQYPMSQVLSMCRLLPPFPRDSAHSTRSHSPPYLPANPDLPPYPGNLLRTQPVYLYPRAPPNRARPTRRAVQSVFPRFPRPRKIIHVSFQRRPPRNSARISSSCARRVNDPAPKSTSERLSSLFPALFLPPLLRASTCARACVSVCACAYRCLTDAAARHGKKSQGEILARRYRLQSVYCLAAAAPPRRGAQTVWEKMRAQQQQQQPNIRPVIRVITTLGRTESSTRLINPPWALVGFFPPGRSLI